MPQVSKNKLEAKAEKELLESLDFIFSSISKEDEMQVFVNTLMTKVEKLMLAKRIGIVVLISQGLNDSQIASTMNVTRITVAKTRYFYEARGKEGFEIGLSKLKQKERMDKLRNVLNSLARYSIRAAGGRVKPQIFD